MPAATSPKQIVTYPAPTGIPESVDYVVKVDKDPVFVYATRVSAMPVNQVWPGYQRPLEQTELASFAYWDFSGTVTVEVTSHRPIDTVVIRPRSRGITPTVEGNTIYFALSEPCSIVVEVNGWHHALHLFTNPIERHAPGENDDGVLFFGPGVHHAGVIRPQDGQTVYIAGGAVVHGVIEATDISRVRVLGRGILDASMVARNDAGPMITFKGCSDVDVRDIILHDPHTWTLVPARCDHVKLSNLKLIGLWRYNSDGIDIVNSEHVVIDRCFVRSFDDSIVIKGFNLWRGYPTNGAPIRDVVVTGCVIWNDWGRALEIGAETQTDLICNIVFRNCDIVHFVHRALDVQNGDRATVRNLQFIDIRVEDAIVENVRRQDLVEQKPHVPLLLELITARNPYSRDLERGRLEQIHLKDVSVVGQPSLRSRISGCDSAHLVEDVTIENLRMQGRVVSSAAEGGFTINEYAKQVRFIPGRRPAT